MRISDWSSDVCSSDLRQVERMGGLNRGNGVFIHKLRHAVPFQQHAEQVIGCDLALQHHTIDQEHRDRMAGLATGAVENFLQMPWLTMVIFNGFTIFLKIRSEVHTSELQLIMRTSFSL